MTVDLSHLLHQALFGGLAASGFGILFNFGWRDLPWCATSGALALAVRTLGQEAGWSVEAASFAAAAAVGCAGQLLHARLGLDTNDLAAAGCIPMVPGLFAAEGILGWYALTVPHPDSPAATAATALEFTLRCIFTIGAIGTALSITTHILPNRDQGGMMKKQQGHSTSSLVGRLK
ncbi:MAG TPA: threonine/serine exporter family protein [Burkholderiales bacterium]|nr:threonine/serine exporter family protein [Burkholderiales bacterium]